MSKTLIIALALSLVLVSGGIYSAQADSGCSPCGANLNLYPSSWHLETCGWHMPSSFNCCSFCANNLYRPHAGNPSAPNDRNIDKGQY